MGIALRSAALGFDLAAKPLRLPCDTDEQELSELSEEVEEVEDEELEKVDVEVFITGAQQPSRQD